jgi:hypothetical protein
LTPHRERAAENDEIVRRIPIAPEPENLSPRKRKPKQFQH